MNKKPKCLLCNKESEGDDDGWKTTHDRERHLRIEHLIDVMSVGINQMVKTAFYNTDLV